MTEVQSAELAAEATAEALAEGDGDGAPERTMTPEEAAQRALERAERPPEALGGPPAEEHDGDDEHEHEHEGDDDEREPGGGSEAIGYAQRLAKSIHDAPSDDVVAVKDTYTEARERAVDGEADEVDYEAIQEWLLSDEAEVNTRELTVRLGGSDKKPLMAPWFIRAVGVDVIRSAEREAAGNRSQRRDPNAPQYDELKANLRIVVEGTVGIGKAPWDGGLDPKQLAQQKGLRDPTTWLARKLQFRPGIIAMLAGQIMALSGFDQEDVRAAGN